MSTAEVEARISNVLELQDACAYGVEVPGSEGKAGMVAILDPENKLDLTKFHAGVKELPSYARPIFVRCVEQLDLTGDGMSSVLSRTHLLLPFTGTYKLKKRSLQAQGFNVATVKDRIFFLDNKQDAYVPLTLELYDDIVKGAVRL